MTALIALCHAPGREARAQAGSVRGRRAKAAARPARPRPQEENEKARELVEEGLRRADQKDWVEAFKAFDRALAVSPRYADAHVAMGDTYVNMGKFAEGLTAYRQAVSVAPSSADAHYSLGAAYSDMEQYADATRHFAQAIRLDPDFAEAHFGLGYANLKRENFREALVHLRRAARLLPDYPEARLALGQTYLGLEDVKAAEKELEILSRLDALAASQLQKEIRKVPGAAGLPDRAERDGRAVSAPPPREKPITTQTAQEPVAGRQAQPHAPNQSGTPTNSPAPSPRPAAVSPRPAALSSESVLAVELSFWESVKNSRDPEEFAAYLNKYPEGQFSELARIRMRALAGKKVEVSVDNTEPKPQTPADSAATPIDSTAAPVAPPKPIAQTPARDAVAQQPKEQLAAEQPAKERPAEEKEPPKEQPKELPKEQPKELPKELPVAEQPKSNEAGDALEAETVEAALDSLRRLLPSKFSYEVRAAAGASAGEAATSVININYEPLKFDGCTVKWRDQNDSLWASLSDLDPEAVTVEPRSRPGATFSIDVWNVSIYASGGKGAINEAKGDGGGTVNNYNGLDLQYDNKERAERLARAMRQAIRLCGGKP